jgi:hypothetical protein
VYNLYICGDCPTNDSQWELEGEFESKPEDNLDQVHPDQMVLKIVKGETEPHEQLPKQLNGGYQAQVHSHQMVSVMTNQGGWMREWWPEDTQNYAKFQG